MEAAVEKGDNKISDGMKHSIVLRYDFSCFAPVLRQNIKWFLLSIISLRIMADTSSNEAKISIKVFVDKVKKRVVYAEADHTFVDILFSFTTLPLGTIVRLLGTLDHNEFEVLGSLNNLYQSLKDFPDRYLSTEECKFLLLNPRSLSYDHCKNLKLKLDDTEPLKHFQCAACSSRSCHPQYFYSTCNMAKCNCGSLMNVEIEEYDDFLYYGGSVDSGVFVSDIASFIVTDDLKVMPCTAESCIRLFTDVGITDKSCLEDVNLDMDRQQALQLLKVALSLDYPLTYLVYQKTNLYQDLISPHQGSVFDQCDIAKNKLSSSSNILLKVSLQRSTGKLLFAEVQEDFIDFLFGFLSIPLGTVVGNLIKGFSSVMDNIFKSISDMSVGRYIKSQDIKDMLLKPHIGQQYTSKNQVFSLEGTPLKYSPRVLKDPRKDERLLKQSGMFIVTDDLCITPSSSNSMINILDRLNVPFDDVEKHEISIGLKEGLRILKASLTSSLTLTDSLELQLKS